MDSGNDRSPGRARGAQRVAPGVAYGKLSRRNFVGGLAAGAALAALAACTRGANPATPTPPPATPAPSGTSTVVFTPPVPVATPTVADPNPGLWAALGERIEAGMRRLQVPGVAVGVLAGGEEQVAGFGMTTEATARPVGPDIPLPARLDDQDLHRHRAHAAGRAGRVHPGHPRADSPPGSAPGR